MTDFHLPGYELLFTTEKSCGHGGLKIYVHNQFSAKPIDINENIHGWERQCIELSHKSRSSKNMSFVISINHPIRLQTISIFSLESSQTLYLSYQIDITLLISVVILILIYYKCIQIIETAVSIGFLPQITLPTRIGEAGIESL